MFENIHETHLKILSLYTVNYSSTYSIREITEKLGINYSNAFKRIKELVEQEILIEEKFGKANCISLNIQNQKTIHLLSIVEQLEVVNYAVLYDICKEITELDLFSCIGIFGSRVSGKAKKNSDWDVFVITTKRKEIERVLSKFPFVSNVELQVFDEDEFIQSLLSIEETVVKHILKNKKIIYNPYPFYNIVNKLERIKYAPTQ